MPAQAEDQFQTALRAHLQNMDQLIDLQDSRLLALEQEFEVELKTLQKEFAEERKHVVRHHTAEVQELSDIISAVEVNQKTKLPTKRGNVKAIITSTFFFTASFAADTARVYG